MKYRKKPIIVEAFCLGKHETPSWYIGKPKWKFKYFKVESWEEIETPEGTMRAHVGDWVIKGIKGELYPCKPDIFEATYEAVEE